MGSFEMSGFKINICFVHGYNPDLKGKQKPKINGSLHTHPIDVTQKHLYLHRIRVICIEICKYRLPTTSYSIMLKRTAN